MEVRIESMICVWDDAIPTMFLEFVNLLTLTTSEGELRKSVKEFAEKHELDKFFLYGFGSHHFYLHQRYTSNPEMVMKNRVLSVRVLKRKCFMTSISPPFIRVSILGSESKALKRRTGEMPWKSPLKPLRLSWGNILIFGYAQLLATTSSYRLLCGLTSISLPNAHTSQ
jgi:hypothetical protein